LLFLNTTPITAIMLGSVESEHPKLINHEIIFEECNHDTSASWTDRRYAMALQRIINVYWKTFNFGCP